jgi:6-phosphogluconolactonase
MLIGGYGPPSGTGTGIYLLVHDFQRQSFARARLAVPTPSPSFLAYSPDHAVVYAVEEAMDGAVHAFRWRTDACTDLEVMGTQATNGSDPCHLLVHPSGRYLLTANYSSGSVVVHPLAADGSICPISDQAILVGEGPNAARQQAAHAHMIAIGGQGTEIAVADLGSDRVWRFSFDVARGRLEPLPGRLLMPPGSGPRQVVFDESGKVAFVLGEMDGSLTIASWPTDDYARGGRSVLASVSTLPPDNQSAALVLSEDGTRLYASHRGADTITVFAVDGASATPIADIPAHGVWPRHIALTTHTLYVANQLSDNVTALSLAPGAGDREMSSVYVPSPTCVIILP